MAELASILGVSRSLAPLREVVASLGAAGRGQLPTGTARRRLVRQLRSAGTAALPALMRAFSSAQPGEAEWAGYLLSRLGGSRLVERLHRLVEDPAASDEVKARAVGLLADLGAPIPGGMAPHDARAMLATTVGELLDSLASHRDVAVAVKLIARVVPASEVAGFAAQVVRHGGEMALPLLDALIAAGHHSPSTLEAVASLRDLVLDDGSAACEPRTLPRRRSRGDVAVTDLRERGLRLVETGRFEHARRPLERAIVADPDDGEARSCLGVCLLELGDPAAALPHLERAAALTPDEPLHHWNVAAAAKGADQLCRAYVALARYLALPDEFSGWRGRRLQARRFVACYEKLIRAMHPGAALDVVLRGEQLFHGAFAAFTDERYDEAAARFREVIALLPDHYPSWGNLGAAELALGNHGEAARCLRRALELKPDYVPARENLALIERRN